MIESLLEAPMTLLNTFRAPRALWGINISYFLEGLVYFGVLTVLGKYMSEDVGLSDQWAGLVYSFFTAGITLAMLFLGGVGDRIGVRKALILALSLMVVGRFFLASSSMEALFTQGQGLGSGMFWCMLFGLAIVVIGYGMYQPASYAGVKQFTNKKTSAMGYAVIYGLMNLGAFVSGLLSPPVRQNFGIGAVYWIFDFLTLLAVVAVVVILTKKTVELTTRRMKEKDKAEEATSSTEAEPEAEKKPSKEAPPQQKWSPQKKLIFVSSLVLTFGCLVGLIYSIINHTGMPVEVTMDRVIEETKDAAKEVSEAGSVTDAAELDAALGEVAGAFDRMQGIYLYTASVPKTPGAFTGTVDEEGLACLTIYLDGQIALAGKFKALAAERKLFDLSTEKRILLKEVLRTHGIYTMSIAYSMVAEVNREIVVRLMKRFKQPGEESIPVSDEIVSQIVLVAGMSPNEKFQEYGEYTLSVARKVAAEDQSGGLEPVVRWLESDAAYAEAVAGAVKPEMSRAASQVVLTKMLADAEFTLETGASLKAEAKEKDIFARLTDTMMDGILWVAGLFSSGEAEEAEESVGESNLTVLSSVLGTYWNRMDQIKGTVGEVYAMPLAAKIADMATSYGPWVVGFLLFVVGTLMVYLKMRPDHPFNNIRFVYFIFILIPVQTLFAHNWLTIPYYINRAFGGTKVGDWFEFFSNLNPLLIFFLAPLVAALTARANVFKMMVLGTLVMAAPTFLLALPPNAWLFVTYILIMSVGEAIWQPRFLQYVAELAPEGKTGIYMGIAQFPWFLTKMVTGFYSGWFLSQYIPRVGPQNPQTLWLIYAFIAMITPVALWFTSRWIQRGLSSDASQGV
jgi:MFS family permease